MDKQQWRRGLLARRALLDPAVRAAGDAARTAALAPLLRGAHRPAAYAAVGTEPATAALRAVRPDLLLPVLLSDGDLDWAAGDLAAGPRGLLEPTGPRQGPEALADCDLVLVPALAVDRDGVRLGRGGGSYDRALARATGLVVALLHEGEFVDGPLPAEPHDRRVGAVATPSAGVLTV